MKIQYTDDIHELFHDLNGRAQNIGDALKNLKIKIKSEGDVDWDKYKDQLKISLDRTQKHLSDLITLIEAQKQ